jgi:hypothetical protein
MPKILKVLNISKELFVYILAGNIKEIQPYGENLSKIITLDDKEYSAYIKCEELIKQLFHDHEIIEFVPPVLDGPGL